MASRWLAGISVLALAACGTTVHGATSTGPAGGSAALSNPFGSGSGTAGQLGSTDSTATTPVGDTAPTAADVGAIGSSPVGGSAGATTPVGSPAFGVPGRPAAFAGGVPGVTSSAISIGLGYAVNSAAANAAIGGSSITQGDQRAYDDAVLNEINGHGGVLGRKLIPVYHQYDNTSTGTLASQFQAACADWTQDHKVFVAFDGENDTLLKCLQDAGVVAIEDNVTPFDDATYQTYPNYFEIGNFSLDRMMVDEVPGLAAQRYFSGWTALTGGPSSARAKVGVLTYDHSTTSHAVDRVLVPELTQLGYAPADVIKVLFPASTSDIGSVAAEVSSAVLKFHNDGVDHVLIVDVSGTLTLLFLNNANSQRYHPRYGFNSQNGAEVLVSTGDAPAGQFAGSLGIGWAPGLDLAAADNSNAGPYSTQARRDCLTLMARHGFTFSNANAANVALATCNSFNFLLQVLARADAPIDRAAFQKAVNGLGSTFQPTDVLAPTSFGPNKHYGAATIRYWDFVPACTCMRYTSGPIAG